MKKFQVNDVLLYREGQHLWYYQITEILKVLGNRYTSNIRSAIKYEVIVTKAYGNTISYVDNPRIAYFMEESKVGQQATLIHRGEPITIKIGR